MQRFLTPEHHFTLKALNLLAQCPADSSSKKLALIGSGNDLDTYVVRSGSHEEVRNCFIARSQNGRKTVVVVIGQCSLQDCGCGGNWYVQRTIILPNGDAFEWVSEHFRLTDLADVLDEALESIFDALRKAVHIPGAASFVC